MIMERERLIEFVDGKPPSTISSYLNNYKKVQGAVGRELHLVSLQEMEQVVNGLTNSYASHQKTEFSEPFLFWTQ